MQHLYGRSVPEVDNLARHGLRDGRSLAVDRLPPTQVCGRGMPDLPFDYVPNVVPPHNVEKAREMVGVPVRQHHHVNRPVPEGQGAPEHPRRVLRFRPSVHQHLAPGRRDDERRVTVAHVREHDVQPSVLAGQRRRPDERDGQRQRDREPFHSGKSRARRRRRRYPPHESGQTSGAMRNEPRGSRPIVAQRQGRGDEARLERRDGELCREVDDLDDVRRRAPRKPAERRSEWLEREAQHTCKGVERQCERQHEERDERRGEAD